MGNILETIKDFTQATQPPITATLSLVKSRKDLDISAAIGTSGSIQFRRTKVDLHKLPMLAVGNNEGPIIIDINANGLRKTSSGYKPKVIIISGADKIRALKKNGAEDCMAWVGEKVFSKTQMNILAAGEVVNKADFIACLDAPNVLAPALGGVNGPSTGGWDVTDFGAPRSELNTPMLKLMLNVEEALAMYQTESATGVHKVIYTPRAAVPAGLINAQREAKIAAMSAGLLPDQFSVMDFLHWQNAKLCIRATAQVKIVDRKSLGASAFAYVGDVRDTSTWAHRIDTPQAAKQSLIEMKSSLIVPKTERKEVYDIIRAAAKCPVCNHIPCDCPNGGKGGPHLGKGKSATTAKKQMDSKRVKATANPIDAGGPGSGRKATMGVANKFGFKSGGRSKLSYDKDTTLMHHHDGTSYDQSVKVKDDGSWEHRKGITPYGASGKDAVSLKKHLGSINNA